MALLVLAGLANPREAAAQLDPLLFLKRTQPNVLLVVDTGNRMQHDATSPNDYLDANVYTKSGALYESPLGITGSNTTAKYRRKYINLQHYPVSGLFSADRIAVVGDLDAGYATFDERTRLSVARRALISALTLNQSVARFGLLKTRQDNPRLGAQGNAGPVIVTDALQQTPTDAVTTGNWLITRPEVDATNASVGATLPLVKPDAANANTTILNTLALSVGQGGALTPGGKDAYNTIDVPLDNMLDDAKTEAVRLAGLDTECRNTVVVLIVGGGEGTTTAEDPAAKATQFLNIGSNHRVPIYVIAIAPPAADVTQLQNIATNSGGQYTEITSAMVSATTAGQPVPEVVKAINTAVQHAFASQADFDTDPTGSLPFGPSSEFQVTSPIVGTVNLEGAKDISGALLTNSAIVNPVTLVKIPQRSNVMITTAFSLPGFDGKLRAFRAYVPVSDSTKPSGFKFVADGTRLWVASVPAAASRNIYTALPDGTLIPFDAAHAANLQPYLNTTDAAGVISFIRSQPLGAIVSSTPAVLDPPSLDPPPDADYATFAVTNKDRRSIVWVGANDGMLHAIDARLGIEVWAFIPFNLLPKLPALRSGQPVGDFRYSVEGSPKVAEVKIDGKWRTYLIIGEGLGGTFYQSFDVTLDNIAGSVSPTSDTISTVLGYFASAASVKLNWAFPRYSSFDVSIAPYGDVGASASAVEKTVGQTWSSPAVGQIESTAGRYAVLTGSGFLRPSVEQQANRGGTRAGTTFYLLDAKDGSVLDSRDVGADSTAETVDDCAVAGDCEHLKNALQADPVATGPPDTRYVTKAYVGDLDGRVWRFDVGLDSGSVPLIKTAPLKLYTADHQHPIFSSMATVTVGTQQYLFFGTGSDLLPSTGVKEKDQLVGVIEDGASGKTTFKQDLERKDIGKADALDEKVSAFPAVAGDIVFFTTTLSTPGDPCATPTANLYAFTFIGGPAYDSTGDDTVGKSDKVKIATLSGRATAPFVVDQHLVFGTDTKMQLFGDPEDFNNGVGQVGVRILSWREVR